MVRAVALRPIQTSGGAAVHSASTGKSRTPRTPAGVCRSAPAHGSPLSCQAESVRAATAAIQQPPRQWRTPARTRDRRNTPRSSNGRLPASDVLLRDCQSGEHLDRSLAMKLGVQDAIHSKKFMRTAFIAFRKRHLDDSAQFNPSRFKPSVEVATAEGDDGIDLARMSGLAVGHHIPVDRHTPHQLP